MNMNMKDFCELDKKIRKEIIIKTDTFGRIKAFKIASKDQFDFMIDYLRQAHTPCCDFSLVNVDGEYTGNDWYFDEQYTTDYGMGAHNTKYYVETLSEKKKRFMDFLAEYE